MNVGVLEAKNRLSELLKAVERGEEVIITNRGVPAAALVPVESREQRRNRVASALEEMRRVSEEITARNGGVRPTMEDILEDKAYGRR